MHKFWFNRRHLFKIFQNFKKNARQHIKKPNLKPNVYHCRVYSLKCTWFFGQISSIILAASLGIIKYLWKL
jgi:hypothetical protein